MYLYKVRHFSILPHTVFFVYSRQTHDVATMFEQVLTPNNCNNPYIASCNNFILIHHKNVITSCSNFITSCNKGIIWAVTLCVCRVVKEHSQAKCKYSIWNLLNSCECCCRFLHTMRSLLSKILCGRLSLFITKEEAYRTRFSLK